MNPHCVIVPENSKNIDHNIKITLFYDKNGTRCQLEIFNSNKDLVGIFKTGIDFHFSDINQLFNIFDALQDYSKRFLKFVNRMSKREVEINFHDFMFIKINNVTWRQGNNKVEQKHLDKKVKNNGLYLGGVYGKYSTFAIVNQNGTIETKFVSKSLLTSIAENVALPQVLFYICIIIEQLVPKNLKKDCEL